MPPTPDRYRISEADREATLAVLGDAFVAGRLDVEEYSRRVASAVAATFYSDLRPLTTDLPGRHGRRSSGPHWRMPAGLSVLWTIWLIGLTVNIVVYLCVAIAGGRLPYPWPLWVALPAGAVLGACTAGQPLAPSYPPPSAAAAAHAAAATPPCPETSEVIPVIRRLIPLCAVAATLLLMAAPVSAVAEPAASGPPVTVTATIDGPAVSATTTAAGQLVDVRFTAAAGQTAYVLCGQALAGGTSGLTQVQMLDPSNQAVGSRDQCEGTDTETVQTYTFTAAGTYTVQITPYATETGTFTVALRSVPPPVTVTATMGGPAVTVTTTAIAQEARVRFSGTAGQRLYAACLQDIPRSEWGWTVYELLDPSGHQVGDDGDCASGKELLDTRTLTATGTYTIVAYPSSDSFGTAKIQLYAVPADASASATIGGEAVTLATTTPGQKMRLTFNGTAGDRVYLTCQQHKLSGSPSDSAWYTLTDPNGELPPFTDIFGLEAASGNCVDPATQLDLRVSPTLFVTQVLAVTGTYSIDIDPDKPAGAEHENPDLPGAGRRDRDGHDRRGGRDRQDDRDRPGGPGELHRHGGDPAVRVLRPDSGRQQHQSRAVCAGRTDRA